MTKYSSRKVLYRDCSGVFTCNGNSLSRAEVTSAGSSWGLEIPWGDPCMKSEPNVTSSHISKSDYRAQKSLSQDINRFKPTRRGALPTLEQQLAAPLSPPIHHHSRLDDSAAYRAAKDRYTAAQVVKAKLYTHIYFDDKVVRSDKESALVDVGRLWFPRLNCTKALQSTYTAFVQTPVPRNRSLGLSPLRILGPNMQDKAHHISPSKNITRLITKIPSRKYTGPI